MLAEGGVSNYIETGSLHERIDAGGAHSGGVGSGEQIILSAQCDETHSIFGDIIVDLQPAVGQEPVSARRRLMV